MKPREIDEVLSACQCLPISCVPSLLGQGVSLVPTDPLGVLLELGAIGDAVSQTATEGAPTYPTEPINVIVRVFQGL